MRRILLLIVLLLACRNASAQAGIPLGNIGGGGSASTTPVLRHRVLCSLNENRDPTLPGAESEWPVTTINCPMALPTGANNLMLLEIQYQSNAGVSSISWSDNVGGDTYSLVTSCTDSTNNQKAALYKVENVPAGVQSILGAFVGGTPYHVSMAYQELYNVPTSSTIDAYSCTATGSNITAGSAINAGALGMLGHSNDAILYMAFAETASISTCVAGSGQTDITWSLISCDLLSGSFVQMGTYTTNTTLNPKATSGTTATWIAMAVAVNGIIAGTRPPSGIYVAGLQWNNTAQMSNPVTLQTPCIGNLQVLDPIFDYNPGYSISSISDTNSNVWNLKGSAREDQIWDAENSTCSSTETQTVTLTGTVQGDASIAFYDIVNAAASPMDTSAGVAAAVGNQMSGSSTPVTTFNFTPSASGELVLAEAGLQYNNFVGINSPSGALFDACFYSVQPSVPSYYCENNGYAVDYTTSGGTQTWTWQTNGTTPIQIWAAMANAYIVAPGPGIQKIQDAGSATGGGPTTTTVNAVNVGNLVAGMARDGNAACATDTITVADNGSPAATWNASVTYSDATNGTCQAIVYAMNVIGSPTAVTATAAPGGGAFVALPIAEISGALTQGATDGTAAGSTHASAQNWTTPTITTLAGSWIIACLGTVGAQATGLSVTAGTGTATWTLFSNPTSNTVRGTCAYAIPSAAGTYSAEFVETGTAVPAETLISAFK